MCFHFPSLRVPFVPLPPCLPLSSLPLQASEKSPSNASPRPSVENERLCRCQGNAWKQAERVKEKPLIVTFSHPIEDHVNQNVSPTPAGSITAESQREGGRWRSLRWKSDALISERFIYKETNCSFTSAERLGSIFKHKWVYAYRHKTLHQTWY